MIYRLDENVKIFKKNPAKIFRTAGPTGPQGEPGSGGTRTTVLQITKNSPSGTEFFVNSSGTNYIQTGDLGDLGETESFFLEEESIQLDVNGSNLIKSEHLTWTSRYSFIFLIDDLYNGDWVRIIT